MKVSVLGLGRVGLPLSAALAAAGHRVVGVDVSSSRVAEINSGDLRTSEPDVADRLASAAVGAFIATTSADEAIAETDLTFIVVPTPSNTLGGYSLRYALEACRAAGEAMRTKSRRHTVAVVSTVLPGSGERHLIPVLESGSGGRAGKDFGYCYNPAFIALGDVLKGFERPSFLLVGHTDESAAEIVLEAHEPMVKVEAPTARMSVTEAEICKLASNTYETMQVSFANLMLMLCSEVPGANVDRITEALAHRVGRRFFKGATPYGGPCWPRDNEALASFLGLIRGPAYLPRSVDTFNADHSKYVFGKVLSITRLGERVGIVGLAYKPGTNVIERSFAIELAKWLISEGREVVAWDPMAIPEAMQEMGETMDYAQSLEDCLLASSTVVLTLPLPEAAAANWNLARSATVVDAWRFLPEPAQALVGRYVPLGEGPPIGVREWLAAGVGPGLDMLTN